MNDDERFAKIAAASGDIIAQRSSSTGRVEQLPCDVCGWRGGMHQPTCPIGMGGNVVPVTDDAYDAHPPVGLTPGRGWRPDRRIPDERVIDQVFVLVFFVVVAALAWAVIVKGY